MAVHLHGTLYRQEYGYGVGFEAYVAGGLYEFYKAYDASKDKVWICEQAGRMCAFLLLQHRSAESAQLRYFFVIPECRRTGLGGWLMNEFMVALTSLHYRHAYLWTTRELISAARIYIRSGFRLTEEKASGFFGKPVLEQRYDWFDENSADNMETSAERN